MIKELIELIKRSILKRATHVMIFQGEVITYLTAWEYNRSAEATRVVKQFLMSQFGLKGSHMELEVLPIREPFYAIYFRVHDNRENDMMRLEYLWTKLRK